MKYIVYMHTFDEEENLTEDVVYFSGIGEDGTPEFECDMSDGVIFDSVSNARFLKDYVNFTFPYNGVSLAEIEDENDV